MKYKNEVPQVGPIRRFELSIQYTVGTDACKSQHNQHSPAQYAFGT